MRAAREENPAFYNNYLTWRRSVAKRRSNFKPNQDDFRQLCVAYSKYGHAVPNNGVLEFIASTQQPVIEIGAGNGYVASLLKHKGVDVTAVDFAPTASNMKYYDMYQKLSTGKPIPEPRLFTEVEQEFGQDFLSKNGGCSGHTLLMLYPPDDAFSFVWRFDFTREFKGDTIIFCFSQKEKDSQLSDVLVRSGWREVASIDMPRWFVLLPEEGDTAKLRKFARS